MRMDGPGAESTYSEPPLRVGQNLFGPLADGVRRVCLFDWSMGDWLLYCNMTLNGVVVYPGRSHALFIITLEVAVIHANGIIEVGEWRMPVTPNRAGRIDRCAPLTCRLLRDSLGQCCSHCW